MWTNLETIQTHLQLIGSRNSLVYCEPYQLHSENKIQLKQGFLVEKSFVLQGLRSNKTIGPVEMKPLREQWTNTGFPDLLPESVVVATDPFPVNLLVRGRDYVVDELNGMVQILGDLANGEQKFYVWAIQLHNFRKNVDYVLDSTRGTLDITKDGDISLHSQIYATYQSSRMDVSDALITNTILDAEGKITARLKSDVDTASLQEVLKMGATELTLALLCDDFALRQLLHSGDSALDDRAKKLMDMAEKMEQRATRTLSPYLRMPLPSSLQSSKKESHIHYW